MLGRKVVVGEAGRPTCAMIVDIRRLGYVAFLRSRTEDWTNGAGFARVSFAAVDAAVAAAVAAVVAAAAAVAAVERCAQEAGLCFVDEVVAYSFGGLSSEMAEVAP